MPRQLTFPLPVREALGRADYYVSPANALAVAAMDGWHNWPDGKMVLTGPEGAGKSHLAHVWASEAQAVVFTEAELAGTPPGATPQNQPATLTETLAAGAHVVVEDADRISGNRDAEVTLFHLHNLVLAGGGRLLLTARSAPNRWPLVLPDLASRMQATATTMLEAPDDALLSAVLVKLFADRQLNVPPAVIAYLAARMERSLDAARQLVAAIDARALTEGRAVTRVLAAEVLDSPPGDSR